jgi:hypothetical protein
VRIFVILSTVLIAGLVLVACTYAPLAGTKPASSKDDAPTEAQLRAAGEAGDVEAQRQLAYRSEPKEAFGVTYGNAEAAIYWYRRACAAGYANAEVDFYEFAETRAQAETGSVVDEAVACLDDAVRQGHRNAIIDRAFRAAFGEHDYKKGYYLYALLADSEPQYADQRHSIANQLTPAEIDAAEKAAADWRAGNQVRDYNDFFAVVNSPFRQPIVESGRGSRR